MHNYGQRTIKHLLTVKSGYWNRNPIIKSSPFERAMKVEAELNKLHGRIIKQLDSIKAYELEDRRLQLAEKQLELNKQKLTGEFEIDPDGSAENDEITGVVDDV